MQTLTPDQYRQISGKRGNKYRAQITEVDGIRFHSKREASRWSELKLLEKAGEITDLNRQVRFEFKSHSIEITTERGKPYGYVADFTYRDKSGLRVIEDVKGVTTPLAKLKLAIMAAFGCPVTVVR